jgi:hypothetical protein
VRRALAIGLLTVSLAAPARAHDSLAPRGASHNWLPTEEWVARHWIPFDEQALKAELGLKGRDLHAYLYNDHRTLAALSDDPEALADRLVAPWQGIGDEHRALLRERTLRILTQGHLAQHMFFHVYHGAPIHRLFGPETHAHRSASGETYAELALRHGIGLAAVKTWLATEFETDRRDGVERLEAWPSEADRLTARRLSWLHCWLTRPPPGQDPANPYGKNRFLHGAHAAGWPATASQRREDDRRVDRFRRALPKSCWPIPPRWSP